MVIIEFEFKKLKNASILKHKILSSSEISPNLMMQIINIFQSIADDILNISENTYSENLNNDYIVVQYEHETLFTSVSGSPIHFSFIFEHHLDSSSYYIKIFHD